MQADDSGVGWAAQDLTKVEDVPQPTILQVMLGKYLIRCGWVTLVHGEFGSGKTPVCYIAVVEQVRAGNLAMIVDHEMGQSQAVALLRELGLTDDEIVAGVYFCHQPPPMSSAGQRRVAEEVAAFGRRLTVVVIDSLSASMAMAAGSSDNDSLDVAAWFAELPVWLADTFNAAVLVIDHSGVSDGPRPSGSHKKREVPQFHIWVEKVAPFSRARPEAGRSNLRVMKDRSGDSVIKAPAAVLLTRPGGSFYLTTPEAVKENKPRRGEVADLPLDEQPEDATDDDVLADLLSAGHEGTLKTPLCGRGDRGKYRRAAVERLVEAGRAVERKERTKGNPIRLWAYVFAPKE
ncbi:AAA family ATPase [Nocardioides donggukensis]|uniref:AAA family ATPase n=1 Tax=Nocardioides donggukensis TaxID=2774019 RepID=A0A927Q320_9ACTN|nr:AAA family ATPase [Nocardioides donggukensis]MBD8870929.1 AAA family ATPase [Nocardioides donggukensis]